MKRFQLTILLCTIATGGCDSDDLRDAGRSDAGPSSFDAATALDAATPDASTADAASPAPDATTPDASMFECPDVSAEMPYDSQFVDVLGSRMHYVEDGSGEVVLMLHGQPVSAYFWRNVIPHLSDDARVIAMDHIGFGQSDRPDIDYTIEDQVRYLAGFIEALDLRNITLVVQDLGSLSGLIYASENSGRIRAVAMLEALIPPVVPVTSSSAPPMILGFWQALRDPMMGPALVLDGNIFFDDVMAPDGSTLPGVLSAFTLCGPSPEAEAIYRAPFTERDSRLALLAGPAGMPIDGEPAALNARFVAYADWLTTSPVPKLVMYATPGALITEETAMWAGENMPNTTVTPVGPGIHFVAESRPDAVGTALSDWYGAL